MVGALALLTGVLLALASARLPGDAWLACAATVAALVCLSPLRHRPWPRWLALLLVGMLLASCSTRHWLERRVSPAAADARVLLEGRVLSVPARVAADLRFDAEVIILEGPAPRDGRIRRARLAWRDAPATPRVGERWRFLVRLAPLADTRNFAGRDVERVAFRDRVHLAGRVLPAALNARLSLASASLDGARARVAARIADQVADPDAAALLTALAVGITDGMSADQWRVFNATGTTHLVAISGLHVTLFALLAFCVARLMWRALPLVTRIEREPFALLLGLAAAGAYSLLAGLSVPTQRTWLMLGVFALVRLQARHCTGARTLALALIAVLLLDPFAPLAAGFWLSFVAVGVILFAGATLMPPVRTLAARTWSAVRLQLAIMLALAPLTFAVFGAVSIAGLWVNLAAIPLVSFALVPLVLAGAVTALWVPAVSTIFFSPAATLYEWLWPALAWAADAPSAQWRMAPAPWWLAFALLASFIVLRCWPPALRWTTLCVLLPLLFAPARGPAAGTARVHIFDAGRGAAALVVTHSHVLLFDTGDAWNTRATQLRQLVLPALDALGRARVDLLILPGLNPDRALSAALLASERDLTRIVVGGGWPATSLPVAPCRDGAFRWDGVDFATFAAGEGGRHCALRIAVGTHAVLLGGDLDAAAERGLVARTRGALHSVAVLLSKNASSLGSTPEWIEASGAGLAVATGGSLATQSRDATLERWRDSGATIVDTRRAGAVELGLGTHGIVVLRRACSARYPFAWRRFQCPEGS